MRLAPDPAGRQSLEEGNPVSCSKSKTHGRQNIYPFRKEERCKKKYVLRSYLRLHKRRKKTRTGGEREENQIAKKGVRHSPISSVPAEGLRNARKSPLTGGVERRKGGQEEGGPEHSGRKKTHVKREERGRSLGTCVEPARGGTLYRDRRRKGGEETGLLKGAKGWTQKKRLRHLN